MAEFDAAAAKAAGYSDADIARIQAGIARARAAGYDDAAIGQYLASGAPEVSAAPPPASPWVRVPEQVVSNFAAGLASVVPGIPADIGNAIYPNANWPTSARVAPAVQQFFGGSDVTTAPQSDFERITAAGARGLGQAVPLAFLPGAGSVGANLLAGATGGAVGEAANELLPGAPSAATGGLAAGLAVQGGRAALAGTMLRRALRGLGSSQTAEDSGIALQTAARDWLEKEKPQMLADFWSPVDGNIPANTPVGLNGYKSALADINSSGGNLQSQIEMLRPKLPKSLADDLAKQQAANTLAGQPTQYTWQEAQKLRSALGDAMSNPRVLPDIGEENLSYLYRALSDDMRQAAFGVSPAAEEMFNYANEASQDLYNFSGRTLGRIVAGMGESEKDPYPGVVARRLIQGATAGGSELAAMRKWGLGDAVDELAAGALAENPKVWSRLSPGGKAALIDDPAVRAQLEAEIPNTQPGLRGPLTTTAHGIESLAGSIGGHAIGTLIGHHLGYPELSSGSAGELIGLLGAPMVRGAYGVLKNPLSLTTPAIGAFGGIGNQLWPSEYGAPTGETVGVSSRQ